MEGTSGNGVAGGWLGRGLEPVVPRRPTRSDGDHLGFVAPSARGESATDGKERELRMLGAGSQVLSDLGAGKVRVLGTPLRTHALSGFGLEVLEYLPGPGTD